MFESGVKLFDSGVNFFESDVNPASGQVDRILLLLYILIEEKVDCPKYIPMMVLMHVNLETYPNFTEVGRRQLFA